MNHSHVFCAIEENGAGPRGSLIAKNIEIAFFVVDGDLFERNIPFERAPSSGIRMR